MNLSQDMKTTLVTLVETIESFTWRHKFLDEPIHGDGVRLDGEFLEYPLARKTKKPESGQVTTQANKSLKTAGRSGHTFGVPPCVAGNPYILRPCFWDVVPPLGELYQFSLDISMKRGQRVACSWSN